MDLLVLLVLALAIVMLWDWRFRVFGDSRFLCTNCRMLLPPGIAHN